MPIGIERRGLFTSIAATSVVALGAFSVNGSTEQLKPFKRKPDYPTDGIEPRPIPPRRQLIADHIRHHLRAHLSPAQLAASEVSPADRAAWDKVNICEESGQWNVAGSVYSGGLGISDQNWVSYGGQQFSPTAATATPDEQIVVAERIQPSPPDQNGCQPGGW